MTRLRPHHCGSNKIAIVITVAAINGFAAFSGATVNAEAADKSVAYAIDGTTPIALYQSIGLHGPNGSIAQTDYSLTWKRLFDERGGDCYLVSATPVLSIKHTYPKPRKALTGDTARRWKTFIDGVRKHEEEHAVMIRAMVARTQAAIDGAVVRDDKTCAKVKAEVSRRIDAVLADHKAATRAFDRDELSEGGTVHQLVLALVNR